MTLGKRGAEARAPALARLGRRFVLQRFVSSRLTPVSGAFQRRATMEAVVRPHLGSITPEIAAQIPRDRSNSRYVNDSTVANLFVLNAAVIHPASKTLWQSTTMQLQAPFGETVLFSVAPGVTLPDPLRLSELAGVECARRLAHAANQCGLMVSGALRT
jgi:hypothetical protein